ncbi:helix-turn-helix domain-containing protein [Mycobacterium sp.]|jgi:TetR/AcrR family acrAB operon transcriptional repressor|uniref:TetR/AcrR family transcriptional regulator n=1 Tax=Mycobacterium sp. TaxID=1785 RepID=UPI0033423826|nr:acrR 2 [Mycobacterium sp.]
MASRRAETSRESRRLLIGAATELFAERGFRRTTFEDIAERSGISRGSIPWHFGNKDGLLEAVIDELTASIFTTMPRSAGLSGGLEYAREFTGRPASRLLITLLAEAVEPGSPVHGFYAELHAAMRKWIADWTTTEATPRGVSREDFVTIVLAAIIGIHQQYRVDHDAINLDAAFSALHTILTAGADKS